MLDDPSPQTEILKGYFRKFSHRRAYDVETASNGGAAATALRRGRPDLILLDTQMRGLNGLAFLRQVRALDRTIPVIVVTGQQATGAVVEVLHTGVFAYVPKPCEYPQIEHLVALVFSAQFNATGAA
ncbi:MAG: response regulator [Candidatus Rokuibacteriota bacterium]